MVRGRQKKQRQKMELVVFRFVGPAFASYRRRRRRLCEEEEEEGHLLLPVVCFSLLCLLTIFVSLSKKRVVSFRVLFIFFCFLVFFFGTRSKKTHIAEERRSRKGRERIFGRCGKNDKNEIKKQVIYLYVCYWPGLEDCSSRRGIVSRFLSRGFGFSSLSFKHGFFFT